MRYCSKLKLIFLCSSLITGCGLDGGGSGGGTIEPAQVNMSVRPDVLDSGERTNVKLTLYDFTSDQVIIKIRYPEGLSYVFDSSFYIVRGIEIDTGPDYGIAEDSENFLVYFLDTDEFDNPSSIDLAFQFRAVEDVEPTVIEVDVDQDDPAIDNDEEFVAESPQFDIQNSAYIQVGRTTTTASSN